MRRRSTVNLVLAMSFAIVATAVSAMPAAAYRVLKDTGTQGYYEIYDQMGAPRGATCSYESVSQDLDKMRIKPPLMHGYYNASTPVQWRFKIRRNAPGGANTFSVIYTSSWQSDTANNAIPANGFTNRAWTAPGNPSGFFQVVLELRWLYQGSVKGFLRAQIEWYKAKWSGNWYENNEYCLENY